jgi:hypothetical protein
VRANTKDNLCEERQVVWRQFPAWESGIKVDLKQRLCVRAGIEMFGQVKGLVAGCYERGNENSGSINGRECHVIL